MKKTLSLMLACLIAVLCLPVGIFADTPDFELPEIDQLRIRAFLDTETNVSGVTNEDVINDWEVPTPIHWIRGNTTMSPIVNYSHVNTPPYNMYITLINFSFDVCYGIMDTDPFTGEPLPLDVVQTFRPDVYGIFDLSDSTILCLGTPEAGQTHINGVILNNCVNLTTIDFQGQEHCTKLSAVNCDNLSNITALDCDYQEITVQPRGFSEPVSATVLGEGSIGMTCSYSDNSCELYAKNNGEFRGWYVDGELISTDYMLSVEYGEGIDIVACYTDDYSPVLLGDVDGDSSVTLADAIHVARCAIGVSTLSAELPNAETAADFDGNGRIDMTDAILIARVAIGVA